MLCERLLNVDGPSSLEIVLVTRVNSTNFQSLPRIHIGERLRGYDETFTKNIGPLLTKILHPQSNAVTNGSS